MPEPAVWWAIGLALIALLLRFAFWYSEIPPRPTDLYYGQIDEELDRFYRDTPLLIGSPLDTNEYDLDVHEIAEEMCEDIQAWLRARRVWEGNA